MQRVSSADEVINSTIIKPGSILYVSGNAAPPQELLSQLADDLSIKDVDMYSILLLGDRLKKLFAEERCQDLTHRVIFNSRLSQEAVNKGWAKYHPMHLSEVPRYVRRVKPNIVLLTVRGPDKAGYCRAQRQNALRTGDDNSRKYDRLYPRHRLRPAFESRS